MNHQNRREGTTALLGLIILLTQISAVDLSAQQIAPEKRPNLLMIVADDMNWDSPGCFGGVAPDVTPRIDRLAEEGMRFQHGYVNISICTPSRSVLLTGLYPHNNGAEGFQRIREGTPNLPSILNQAGYFTGIVGKPLRQQDLFRWSVTYRWQGTGDEDRWGRDPQVFQKFARNFFRMARTSQQPFFLMANSHDPHRPFGGGKATRALNERAESSRTYHADEVRVPGFLPDLPGVRSDLAEYATSVRRLDDTVGLILDELESAGYADDTLVVFLSDHGMPFPGAKFNCYMDSVRSPFIFRWPGKIAEGSLDKVHMVSTVDFQSTLLDALGFEGPPRSDGRSFFPLLTGKTQNGRDQVFAQFYHIHGDDALPMYSVLTRTSAYVFNPWSNGERQFRRLGGDSYKAMKQSADSSPRIAAAIHHLTYRSLEEFFLLNQDAGWTQNLFHPNQSFTTDQYLELRRLRYLLQNWMEDYQNDALDVFKNRRDKDLLESFIKSYRSNAARQVEDLIPYEKSVGFRF